MLIGYGCQQVPSDWHVDEKSACGYVRVYDIYSGQVWYQDAVGKTKLSSGSICLFPSSAPFRILHNPEDPLICTHLHLDIAPSLLPRLQMLTPPAESVLRGLFNAVRAAVLSFDHQMLALLAGVFEHYCLREGLFEQPEGELARVMSLLSQDCRREWTLEEMSAMAGYTESYFIRLFRSRTGISPYQYLIRCRMKEAVRLMQDTALTY